MNSILRQGHVRSSDLRDYMRIYDSNTASAVSSWTKSAISDLSPGSLVFIVEPVSLPFGLMSFSNKDEENYRATDFAVVVRAEDSKLLVINVTSHTYELRFLEALIEERARKAVIEGKKFTFVTAKPAVPLVFARLQELERLSGVYAKGGTRRSFMSTDSQEEPAIGLLSVAGVQLNYVSVNKQPIDIGSICSALFGSESKIPDSTRSQLKGNFIPVLAAQETAANQVSLASQGAQKSIDLLSSKARWQNNEQDNAKLNLLQSWGGDPAVKKEGSLWSTSADDHNLGTQPTKSQPEETISATGSAHQTGSVPVSSEVLGNDEVTSVWDQQSDFSEGIDRLTGEHNYVIAELGANQEADIKEDEFTDSAPESEQNEESVTDIIYSDRSRLQEFSELASRYGLTESHSGTSDVNSISDQGAIYFDREPANSSVSENIADAAVSLPVENNGSSTGANVETEESLNDIQEQGKQGNIIAEVPFQQSIEKIGLADLGGEFPELIEESAQSSLEAGEDEAYETEQVPISSESELYVGANSIAEEKYTQEILNKERETQAEEVSGIENQPLYAEDVDEKSLIEEEQPLYAEDIGSLVEEEQSLYAEDIDSLIEKPQLSAEAINEEPVSEELEMVSVELNQVLDQPNLVSSSGERDENSSFKVSPEEEALLESIRLEDIDTTNGSISGVFPTSEIKSTKLGNFREPKVVMNEMTSLMSKLEVQVARAAQKLATKATEIERRLANNFDALLGVVHQDDKDAYAELVVRVDILTRKFETLFDELKTELAEEAANSREQIKNKLPSLEEKIVKTKEDEISNLVEEFKASKNQFEQLVADQNNNLNRITEEHIETFRNRLSSIAQAMESNSARLSGLMENQFSDFRNRVDADISILLKSLDYRLDAFQKDVERARLVGTEQLVLAKGQFLDKLERLTRIIEIDLSRQARNSQVESFLPKLKERKQIIENLLHEMILAFGENSLSLTAAQKERSQASLTEVRHELKKLLEANLNKMSMIGRSQQSGLEEIFKSVAEPMEKYTSMVSELLMSAEEEINECESLCTKLARSYSLDNDPKITALCESVQNKVELAKIQLKDNIESTANTNCARLEEFTRDNHVKLHAQRSELVQQVRSASEKGLTSIRQAIHETFNTIQIEREKNME